MAHNIRNSNPPYHFLSPLQTILWGIFFWQQFNTTFKKQFIAFATIILVIFSVINSIAFQSLYEMPDNVLKVQSFAFIIFSFFLFLQKIDDPTNTNIFKDPIFLATVALLWFSIIWFIFINFHRYLATKVVSRSTLKIVNYVSNYVYYLTLLVAVILSRKSKRHDNQ
jgi:hypothetical protein